MISINDYALPSPHALSVHTSLRGGFSQYNALGQLVQEGMQEKRVVEITWRHMPGDQVQALAEILRDGGFFTLVYPDPLSGQRQMQCCLQQHSARVFRYDQGVPAWADVKLTLEEQ